MSTTSDQPKENEMSSGAEESFFEAQRQRLPNIKKQIAEYAVKNFLSPGDSVVIDAGSSLVPAATAIVEGKERKYTIMTHNFSAFEELKKAVSMSPTLNVLLTGGRYDSDLDAFFGDQTRGSYGGFGAAKVFLGVSALSAAGGLYCRGNTEEPLVKELISKLPTSHRIILADFTKFGRTDALKFADTNDLNVTHTEQGEGHEPVTVRVTIVTDRPTKEKYERHLAWLEDRGVNLKYVPDFDEVRELFELEAENFARLNIRVVCIPEGKFKKPLIFDPPNET